MLLYDRQRFYETWILNLKQDTYKPAFEEGSVTHSLILEPEKVAAEYAFYEGLRRAGAGYEAFVAANPGKKVVTTVVKARAEKHRQALLRRPEAVSLLQNGLSEQNMFGKILGVPVKARADYINVEQGIIVDLKTSAYPSGSDFFKSAVLDFRYDLSAALYKQIAEQAYQKQFQFYWVVISKADNQCHVYKASAETLRTGTALCMQALVIYKNAQKTGNYLTDTALVCDTSSTYEIEEV